MDSVTPNWFWFWFGLLVPVILVVVIVRALAASSFGVRTYRDHHTTTFEAQPIYPRNCWRFSLRWEDKTFYIYISRPTPSPFPNTHTFSLFTLGKVQDHLGSGTAAENCKMLAGNTPQKC